MVSAQYIHSLHNDYRITEIIVETGNVIVLSDTTVERSVIVVIVDRIMVETIVEAGRVAVVVDMLVVPDWVTVES